VGLQKKMNSNTKAQVGNDQSAGSLCDIFQFQLKLAHDLKTVTTYYFGQQYNSLIHTDDKLFIIKEQLDYIVMRYHNILEQLQAPIVHNEKLEIPTSATLQLTHTEEVYVDEWSAPPNNCTLYTVPIHHQQIPFDKPEYFEYPLISSGESLQKGHTNFWIPCEKYTPLDSKQEIKPSIYSRIDTKKRTREYSVTQLSQQCLQCNSRDTPEWR